MSTRSALSQPASAPRAGSARGRALRRKRRRRLTKLVAFAAFAAFMAVLVLPRLPDAVRELALPLRHEDIIRQQASAKQLDPSLLAAVIYAESRFRDQTSHAGARGLMQITPATARYIAKLSGGTTFEQGDLGSPQINIAYGAYYLRYLLDRYGENRVLALAAYNGGEGNVDRWIAQSGGPKQSFSTDQIPFAETRDYVGRVLGAQQDYRRKYRRELGL